MGSNSLAFKEWALHEGLVSTKPIDQQFENRNDPQKRYVVGIDADDYLQSLLTAPNKEPLLPALGGLPFTLKDRVDNDLDGFDETQIDPIFVFNGLDLACKDRTSIFRDSRKAATTLGEAWRIYDEGKGDEAVVAFGQVCNYRSYHIARTLLVHLHQKGCKVQIAPYSAAAELVYMERKRVIDAMVGSASCLLFGAEKVIFNFDHTTKHMTWITLNKCLSKLNLTRDQFFDTCLLSGSSILPALPDIDRDPQSQAPSKMVAARNYLMARNNGDVNQILGKDDNYRRLYEKARSALQYPVVVTKDGKVEQQNSETGPGDVHEFIGQRLPDEIYHYLSRGIVGPRVLNWRTRMEILETPPLDTGASQTYQDLVHDKLRPLRAQALALMTQTLNRYYQKNDVDLVCWWNESSKMALGIPDIAEPAKSSESWHVKTAALSQDVWRDAPERPLFNAIMSLASGPGPKETVTSRGNETLRSVKDISANAVWRFLADRGYITSDHKLTGWGRALKVAFDKASQNNFSGHATSNALGEEPLFMAFELLRLDVLNGKEMFPTPPYSGTPMRGSEKDKANNIFVSRVACLGQFRHGSIGYTGPLSRNLLAYHQMAAAVRGSLRDLVEMHACHMFLSGSVSRDLANSEYTDVAASLPFIEEPDLGLALLVKCHLDELCTADPSKRTNIQKWFNHASDIAGDLENAWRMWDCINTAVQSAETNIINADIKRTFQNADKWLKEKLESAQAPNGTS